MPTRDECIAAAAVVLVAATIRIERDRRAQLSIDGRCEVDLIADAGKMAPW